MEGDASELALEARVRGEGEDGIEDGMEEVSLEGEVASDDSATKVRRKIHALSVVSSRLCYATCHSPTCEGVFLVIGCCSAVSPAGISVSNRFSTHRSRPLVCPVLSTCPHSRLLSGTVNYGYDT